VRKRKSFKSLSLKLKNGEREITGTEIPDISRHFRVVQPLGKILSEDLAILM